VTVGHSKLREKEGLSLGKQYRGSRVSRDALEQSSDDDDEEEEEDDEDNEDDDAEYDDPETANLEADTAEASDSEISSDNALAESDDERLDAFVFRGSSKPKKSKSKRATAADFMSASEDEENSDGAEIEEDEDEDSDEDMDDGLDALLDGAASDEDGEEDEDEEDDGEEDEEEDEEEEDEDEESGKPTAKPSLDTSSNQTEVQKGNAIQQQRKIYDGLLNMRIRLQKAIVAANTFTTLEDSDSSSEAEAYEAAEEAAIKLLNTISDLRENLAPPTAAGSKRKRALDIDFSNQQIWEQIQEDDRRSIKFREDRLDKWSRKVQSVTVAAPASRLGAKPKTLISALQDQLANPDGRLVKRTRVPRSCAPVQASKKITESEDIYDDADFYQLLLKELVDQRTVESAAEQSNAVASVMLTANKEAKTRKVVDRKASKGRKLRFTVHEKLQNFMAQEDRRAWEQGAIDRFFGTLFGQKLELNEEESEDDEMEALYKQDEGLRLFK
jgi:protein AATF/BFR2